MARLGEIEPDVPQATAGESRDVLRFATAGSVDDGKSTLIGRLLHDTRQILGDQLAAASRASRERGSEALDLSLFTDGLEAEREQGITIDVAYRCFSTTRRKFILADTPGHEQYTCNMVTGASTADAAVVLVDASRGLRVQSRRHAFIASLLRIPELIVAVNKMDIVDYSRDAFERICDDFRAFLAGLDFPRVSYVPISALRGDMVVERGGRMPWYRGATLLERLERVRTDRALEGELFFPVQLVSRPGESGCAGRRGYLGRIVSGGVRAGDAVTVYPAGRVTRVHGIGLFDREVTEARAPDSVTLYLEDQLDVSRGDLIAQPESRVRVTKQFDAMLCWFADEALVPGGRYLVKHGTRTVKARLGAPVHRVNVTTLEYEAAGALSPNDIGRVPVQTTQPLAWRPYREHRSAGSFIVIDESSYRTVAAGMIT